MSDPHWALGGFGALALASLLVAVGAWKWPPCRLCNRRRHRRTCLLRDL